MNSLWLRLSAILVVWLIATVALFQATIHFPYFFFNNPWSFYVACAACGALGLFLAKVDRVASLMLPPVLAVASFVVVGVLRLGYFGL